MIKWWMSNNRLTIQANVDDKGIVRWAAPVVKKFVGQHVNILRWWMRKLGGYKEEKL